MAAYPQAQQEVPNQKILRSKSWPGQYSHTTCWF